jgi:hypothetical protein
VKDEEAEQTEQTGQRAAAIHWFEAEDSDFVE